MVKLFLLQMDKINFRKFSTLKLQNRNMFVWISFVFLCVDFLIFNFFGLSRPLEITATVNKEEKCQKIHFDGIFGKRGNFLYFELGSLNHFQ